MANNKLVLIGVLVITLIGGFVLLQQKKSGPVSSQGNLQSLGQEKSTIADLFKTKTPTQCTIEFNEPTVKMLATVYFVGEDKMVMDAATTPENGDAIESHTIRNGDDFYVWSSLGTTGTKFKLSSMPQNATPDQNPAEILKRNDIKYDCRAWSLDNSKFNPPAEIKFTDVTETLPQLPSGGDTPAVNCSLCDQVPAGVSRDQCLQSLNCN